MGVSDVLGRDFFESVGERDLAEVLKEISVLLRSDVESVDEDSHVKVVSGEIENADIHVGTNRAVDTDFGRMDLNRVNDADSDGPSEE